MNWYFPGGNATRHAGPRGTDPNAMNGNAVMYDAVNGKVLTLGGAPNYGVRARSKVQARGGCRSRSRLNALDLRGARLRWAQQPPSA